MFDRNATRWAWGFWCLCAVVIALGLWLPPPADDPVEGLVYLGYATVGAIIAARQPHNPVGWIFLALGLPWGAIRIAEAYGTAALASSRLPGGPIALWLADRLLWIPVLALTGLLLLVFPTGRVPSARWRPVPPIIGIAAVLVAVLAFVPGPLSRYPSVANPFGVPWPGLPPANAAIVIGYAGSTLLTAGLVAAGASLVVRFRHATGIERQQLASLAVAAALLALIFLVNFAWFAVKTYVDVDRAGLPGAALATASQAVLYVALASLPVAAALAMVRHRLFDIEKVVRRTFVYASLAVFITVAYLAIVVGVGAVLGTTARADLLLSIFATAVVALAFQPVRDRLQRTANRLVYGDAAAPEVALADFSRRMSAALSVADLLPRTAEAAARGARARRVRVRLFLTGGGERTADWPSGAPVPPLDWTIPVVNQGETIGEISLAKHEVDASANERRLLTDLARHAGLAFQNARLAEQLQERLVDLSRQADELRASRERIAAAQDAERRRLVRNLHDGAQQHLIALSLTLDLVRHVDPADQGRVGELLDTASRQAAETHEALRDLARGVLPQVLLDYGLEPALRDHMLRFFPASRLTVDDAFSIGRLPERVEVAIYFVCREALQNAAKHAPGAAVELTLRRTSGAVEFTVSDDGPGLDASTVHGSGIANMEDRVASIGGSLVIESRPARGATIRGRIPLDRIPLSNGFPPGPRIAPSDETEDGPVDLDPVTEHVSDPPTPTVVS